MGHSVVLANNFGGQGAVLNFADHGEETRVLPQGYQGHSIDIVGAHARHIKADIVISLYDSWVFPADIVAAFNWVPWAPVDHDPLPVEVKRALEYAYKPIAYSKFGHKRMQDAGLDPAYVPHGIDTSLYCPDDKDTARAELKIPELQDVDFFAVMVAANKGFPSRKAFPEVLWAWREFVKAHPKALLYIHTHAGPHMSGCHLLDLLVDLEMPKANVVFCDQYWGGPMGYPESYMARIYQSADVLVNPAYGEGFGLPIVEAQACGCPVIVNDCTSMSELCFAGWQTTNQPFYSGIRSWQFIPNIASILESLEAAYEARGDTELQKQAREGALGYDVNRVAEQYWEPVLAEIAAGLTVKQEDPLEMVSR